jgi:hypothetical protein
MNSAVSARSLNMWDGPHRIEQTCSQVLAAGFFIAGQTVIYGKRTPVQAVSESPDACVLQPDRATVSEAMADYHAGNFRTL